MLSGSSLDGAQKTLKIKQDDKFYCRLLSKESSIANPSFRVYYGGASGAVPFMWESQPGTPKNAIPSTPLPPLTPPPSYQFNPKRGAGNKSPKNKLLNTILLRLTLIRKSRSTSTPSSSSSFSSSSVSSTSSTFSPIGSLYSHLRCHNLFLSSRSSFSSTGGDGDEDSDDGSTPTSTLCFGGGHGYGGGFWRCYKIAGHGSRHGTTAA